MLHPPFATDPNTGPRPALGNNEKNTHMTILLVQKKRRKGLISTKVKFIQFFFYNVKRVFFLIFESTTLSGIIVGFSEVMDISDFMV
jgi:hypothetical protein